MVLNKARSLPMPMRLCGERECAKCNGAELAESCRCLVV